MIVSGNGARSTGRDQCLPQRGRCTDPSAAEIIRSRPGKWLVWCGLNTEGRQLAKELGECAALIEGPNKPEVKLERERNWRKGETQVLITEAENFRVWG